MSHRAESDLRCPVCHEVFADPVILPCSHSFCEDCLQTWWRERPGQRCPVCRRLSFCDDPPRNLALRNLCEVFSSENQQRVSEPVCRVHSEKLRLFCLDHQELLCLVCRDSKRHKNHRIGPVEEAAEDRREELRESLRPLQEQLKLFRRAEVKFGQTAGHIEVQARNTKRQISEEFQRLHRFLEEEEQARLAALGEEEEQKSRAVKEKMEALSREISALSGIVTSSEETLRAEDVSFLLGYKAAVETVRRRRPLLEEPRLPSGALIDVVRHLGNLSFNIWMQMKEEVSYSPLILDPNTAHLDLVVSEDLTAVRGGATQKLPDNPERIELHGIVLGSEGFGPGTHCWCVEVGDSPAWDVGVVGQSVDRKGRIESGCWEVGLSDGEYAAVAPPLPDEPILLRTRPRRVGVRLDWDSGTLSFSDADTDKPIHTFAVDFSEELLPFVFCQSEEPLRIVPAGVSVAW